MSLPAALSWISFSEVSGTLLAQTSISTASSGGELAFRPASKSFVSVSEPASAGGRRHANFSSLVKHPERHLPRELKLARKHKMKRHRRWPEGQLYPNGPSYRVFRQTVKGVAPPENKSAGIPNAPSTSRQQESCESWGKKEAGESSGFVSKVLAGISASSSCAAS